MGWFFLALVFILGCPPFGITMLILAIIALIGGDDLKNWMDQFR